MTQDDVIKIKRPVGCNWECLHGSIIEFINFFYIMHNNIDMDINVSPASIQP